MKDPLRYFIDEGFGNIYSFRNEDGRIEARICWSVDYKEYTPSFSINENKTTTLTIAGASYITDDEFMMKYAVEVENANEAEHLIREKNAEWQMIKESMMKVDL
jgi:hypothetical protein